MLVSCPAQVGRDCFPVRAKSGLLEYRLSRAQRVRVHFHSQNGSSVATHRAGTHAQMKPLLSRRGSLRAPDANTSNLERLSLVASLLMSLGALISPRLLLQAEFQAATVNSRWSHSRWPVTCLRAQTHTRLQNLGWSMLLQYPECVQVCCWSGTSWKFVFQGR